MQSRCPKHVVVFALATAFGLLTVAPTVAARGGGEVFRPAAGGDGEASVAVTAAGLDFQVEGSYDALALTWAGPDGRVVEQWSESGAQLRLSPLGADGEALPDGLYTYELRGRDGEREVRLESGFFTLRDGAVVSPDLVEEATPDGPLHASAGLSYAAAETTFADDLIVQGSLCLGFDCVTGTSFGFFTLIMRENNNRMLFDDTSSTGSFPRNDWALVFNDTLNGGASRFSIEDCGPGTNCSDSTVPFTLLAGAPDDSLFVSAQGRVGLGTSTPVLKLHLRDGNTPSLRLEQDASSGFAAQTWDVGGNEVNFFVRDLTGGSKLPLRIQAGAPRNALFIATDGNVGLGTDGPAARLDVQGSIAVAGTVDGRDVSADGATLDAHVGDFANPHQVTAAQAGADPAGTAVAAVDGHEAAYDHTAIPSALPVPVSEGGTGATDAAAARANLGVVDAKAGLIPGSSFSGNPGTATVTFASPFPPGTVYAILLTAVTLDAKTLTTANVLSRDETAFTVTLGGQAKDLAEVAWLARPIGE